jgi:hypothetical protein
LRKGLIISYQVKYHLSSHPTMLFSSLIQEKWNYISAHHMCKIYKVLFIIAPNCKQPKSPHCYCLYFQNFIILVIFVPLSLNLLAALIWAFLSYFLFFKKSTKNLCLTMIIFQFSKCFLEFNFFRSVLLLCKFLGLQETFYLRTLAFFSCI